MKGKFLNGQPTLKVGVNIKMKKILIIIVIAAVAIISGFFLGVSKSQKGYFNAGKLTAAIHAYSLDAKERASNLQSSISLQELMTKGFLKQEDVSAFDGMQVTVYLTVNGTNPQAVLISAQLSDGSQMVALADGSVLQVAK